MSADPILSDRYKVLQAEKKFIIEKPTEADAGHYTCTIKGTKDSASFQVLGRWRRKDREVFVGQN